MTDSKLSEATQNFVRASLAYQQASDIMERFAQYSIRVTPLKGAWFSRILYDNPAERFMGDVDLLVSHEDFERAGTCLEQMDYRPDRGLKNRLGFGAVIERAYRRDGSLPVELHHQVATGEGAKWLSQYILEQGNGPDSVYPQNTVMTQTPEQALAALALHFRDHGLRAEDYQLEDIRRLIERLQPDLVSSARLAEQSGGLLALVILLETAGVMETAEIATGSLFLKPNLYLLTLIGERDDCGIRPALKFARKGAGERAWRLLLHLWLARDSLGESLRSQAKHLAYEWRTIIRYLRRG